MLCNKPLQTQWLKPTVIYSYLPVSSFLSSSQYCRTLSNAVSTNQHIFNLCLKTFFLQCWKFNRYFFSLFEVLIGDSFNTCCLHVIFSQTFLKASCFLPSNPKTDAHISNIWYGSTPLLGTNFHISQYCHKKPLRKSQSSGLEVAIVYSLLHVNRSARSWLTRLGSAGLGCKLWVGSESTLVSTEG